MVHIASANMPALETLEVWFGAEYYGAGGNSKMLKKLFEGDGYPALKNLGLKNSEFESEIVQALANAPILNQINRLDLSMGTLDDKGAQIILDNKESFSHLELINLDESHISVEVEAKLKKCFGKKVSVRDQELTE